MNNRIKILASILFIGLIATSLGYQYISDSFNREIRECNNAGKELRFSCYRSVIEEHYADNIQGFSEKIKNHKDLGFQDDPSETKNNPDSKAKNITYAIFGTNCHSFYHAAGDFIATHVPEGTSLKDKLSLGPPSCTSGFMMGVYKRTALMEGYPTSLLSDFYKYCGEFGLHQCAHEIGHILHDKYTYSILKILDDTSKEKYNLSYKRNFNYVATKINNLNEPFERCKKILPSSELDYCYTGIGHNMFLFAEFAPNGFKKVFNECNNVKPEDKEDCLGFIIYRIGQNEAAPLILSEKITEGVRACDDATKLSKSTTGKKHCYIGIGGGIGLYADSEFSGFVTTEKNIPIARRRLQHYINYCKALPSEVQENCIAGLLGTPFRKLYQRFLINDEKVDKVIEKISDDFQIVG